jgi:putative ABC transport system substrate-binding protein
MSPRLAVLDASFPIEQLQRGGAPRYDVFFEELSRLGFREGENLSVLRLSGVGLAEPDWTNLVARALEWDANVLFATPSRMAMQAKALTTSVPIVFVGGSPVTGGLIVNLSRPGGNITGISQDAGEEFYDKQHELLLSIVPSASAIGLLGRSDWWAGPYGETYRTFASAFGLRLVPLLVEGAVNETSLARAFEAYQRDPVPALIIGANSEFIPFAETIAGLALSFRLPAISGQSVLTEAGLLMSYGPNFADIFRRAAGYVSDILSGADPAVMPVEQPAKYDFVVNLRTAEALGITLPPAILLFATEVVE